MENLSAKIEQLKKRGYSKDSVADLTGFRNEVLDIEEEMDFVAHPRTQKFLQEDREELNAIALKLSNDRELSERDRQYLFAKKDILEMNIERFSADRSERFKEISELVDEELRNSS